MESDTDLPWGGFRRLRVRFVHGRGSRSTQNRVIPLKNESNRKLFETNKSSSGVQGRQVALDRGVEGSTFHGGTQREDVDTSNSHSKLIHPND